jgi:hypothetical protein
MASLETLIWVEDEAIEAMMASIQREHPQQRLTGAWSSSQSSGEACSTALSSELCPSSSLTISPRSPRPMLIIHAVTLPVKDIAKASGTPRHAHMPLKTHPGTYTGASNRHKTFSVHPTQCTHAAEFVTGSQAIQLYWPTAHPNTSYTLALTARSSSTAAYASQSRSPASNNSCAPACSLFSVPPRCMCLV